MTPEEIHNIWLHMSGKSEGLLEAGGKADFPVMFANAILEYNKRTWVGLTDEERKAVRDSVAYNPMAMTVAEWTQAVQHATEAKLKEKNNG